MKRITRRMIYFCAIGVALDAINEESSRALAVFIAVGIIAYLTFQIEPKD